MSRDVSFTAKDGSSRPAKQFYLDQGQNHYSVTLVKLADAPAVDGSIVAAAADQLRKKGQSASSFTIATIRACRVTSSTWRKRMAISSAPLFICGTTSSTSLKRAPSPAHSLPCNSSSRSRSSHANGEPLDNGRAARPVSVARSAKIAGDEAFSSSGDNYGRFCQ
jgi:hypothetical protein